MLATEGLQQTDNLGDRLGSFFGAMKVGCTKQPYYDWGFRKMKAVSIAAGVIPLGGHVVNERQVLSEAMHAFLA